MRSSVDWADSMARSTSPENSMSRAFRRSSSRDCASSNEKSGVSSPSISALVTCGANSVNSGSDMELMMSMACLALATDSSPSLCARRWNSPTARCNRSTRWMDRPIMFSQPNNCAVPSSKRMSDSSGSSWLPAGENRLSRRSKAASMGLSAPLPSTSISASNMRYVAVGWANPSVSSRFRNSSRVKVTVTKLRTVGFLRSCAIGSSSSSSR
ncbi:unknown [Bifidobacterium adolescentis CAG:119]|nr:unknown [Bifidobacterium adolescentis CAG:119]